MHAKDLEHGKAYTCTMDGSEGIEKTSIVPLAVDQKNKQRFVIIDAAKLRKGNPHFFRRLIAMSFREIVDEDIDGGPYRDWSSHVWRFALNEDGDLYFEDYDCHLGDFVETDLTRLPLLG